MNEDDPFKNPWSWDPFLAGYRPMPGNGPGTNWTQVGAYLSAGGAAMDAIAGYFQADAQRYQLKSQELAAEFQATMSALNQRAAEHDANVALLEGQTQAAIAGMQARAEKGSAEAAMSASGFELTSGSNAEIRASMDWAKEADRNAITLNSFSAARASRMRAVNYQAERTALQVTASNARASRRTIQPWAQAAGGLLSGAGAMLYKPRSY